MHGEASSALHTAEVVHWITLCVMGIVYTTRVWWLMNFKAGKDRSPPGGGGRTSAKRGAYYSLANVAMPWSPTACPIPIRCTRYPSSPAGWPRLVTRCSDLKRTAIW